MHIIKNAIKALLKNGSEGHLLRYIREVLDEDVFARLSRFVLMLITKVNPKKIFIITQEDKYTCNPKYICEELLKRKANGELPEGVQIVWRTAGNNRRGIPSGCKIVSGGSYDFYKQLFSSQFVIANSVLYVKKAFWLKRKQIVFQTWHGSLGIKRFGRKDYKGGWRWVRAAIRTGRMTDYCITNSSFVSGSLRNTYWQHTPMLEYGHPRNDILFESYGEKRELIRTNFIQKNSLPEDVKFVMYGPTFRDNKNFDVYDIDIEGVINACQERFGGTWVMLLRYHPSLASVYKSKNKLKNTNNELGYKQVINVTDYNDMQELISMCDVAITDYSSWIYDFMLTRKPGFIFAKDIDLYNNERGFCYPLETTPFPIAIDRDELNEKILSFDDVEYSQKLEEFLQDKGCIEDGHASERTVDKIIELMNQKVKKNE